LIEFVIVPRFTAQSVRYFGCPFGHDEAVLEMGPEFSDKLQAVPVSP
jgi:hypothetical protein